MLPHVLDCCCKPLKTNPLVLYGAAAFCGFLEGFDHDDGGGVGTAIGARSVHDHVFCAAALANDGET